MKHKVEIDVCKQQQTPNHYNPASWRQKDDCREQMEARFEKYNTTFHATRAFVRPESIRWYACSRKHNRIHGNEILLDCLLFEHHHAVHMFEERQRRQTMVSPSVRRRVRNELMLGCWYFDVSAATCGDAFAIESETKSLMGSSTILAVDTHTNLHRHCGGAKIRSVFPYFSACPDTLGPGKYSLDASVKRSKAPPTAARSYSIDMLPMSDNVETTTL